MSKFLLVERAVSWQPRAEILAAGVSFCKRVNPCLSMLCPISPNTNLRWLLVNPFLLGNIPSVLILNMTAVVSVKEEWELYLWMGLKLPKLPLNGRLEFVSPLMKPLMWERIRERQSSQTMPLKCPLNLRVI